MLKISYKDKCLGGKYQNNYPNSICTALERIEELLPMVTDDTPIYDRKAIELKIMSDIVIEYEEIHFPIGNPSLADVVKMKLEQEAMSQRTFANKKWRFTLSC